MSVQFVDAACTALSVNHDTYNITSSNNQFSVSIDGGSAQVISLTIGSTRTAANIVSDLSTLTGATASVVTINSQNFVLITDSTSNGTSSTITFNAPANNSNTVLGFVATTYNGGTNVNYLFTGDTKQNLINGIQQGLTNAGWIVVSGSQSTNLLMQSQLTPQNQRMRVNIKDNGNNCVVASLINTSGSVAGTNGTGNGAQLFPSTAKTWRVIANKYQAFVLTPSSMLNGREFACWGVPFIPAHLTSTLYECMWMQGSSVSDTDTTVRGCFRINAGSWGGPVNADNRHGEFCNITNGATWEINNSNWNQSPSYTGGMTLFAMSCSMVYIFGEAFCRWHDGSTFMCDPIISWGSSTASAATAKGLLWDCFVTSEVLAGDTYLTSINGKNWWTITHFGQGGSQGSNGWNRGSVIVVVP
jgi:hypothetical protein